MTASCIHHHPRTGTGKRHDRRWLPIGWVASLLVLLLCAAAPAAAEPGDPSPAAAVRVSSSVGTHLDATIAVNRHGEASVAWVQRLQSDDGSFRVEVRVAQAPNWQPITVVTLPLEDDVSPEWAAALNPLLVAGEQFHLIWTEPSTTTVRVWRYTHDGESAPELWSDAAPYTAVLASDSDGRPQALWAQENSLVLIDGAEPLTSSLTLDLTVSPTELDLAVDAAGHRHAAWAAWQQPDQGLGIYYAALDSDAVPTQVDVAGHSPRLAVGPFGTAYLCWHRAEGLYCADSRDWANASAVAPAVPDERVALAVGPNDVAHVAWSQGGAVWYANSGDWSAVHRLADLDAAYLAMAVDSAGRPHLAATVAVEGGGSELHVLAPASAEPQLAIEAPAAGEWLAAGDALVAVANLPASEWQRVAFYLQPASAPYPASAPPEDALIPVGTDYDGRDGWSVPLTAPLIDVAIAYRVVTVGVDVRGRVASAVGEPVMVRPPGEIDVWVLNPGPDVVQGPGQVLVMTPGAGDDLARLEVSLIAPGCAPDVSPDASICSIPARTFLVASLDVDSSKARPDREWLPITYDSRTLPDGSYRIAAVAIDRDGREHAGVAAGMLTIDNDLAPVVRITEPRPGATVWGTFRAAATVEAGAAPVERVDFYGERQRTLLQRSQGLADHTVQAPDLVWLGSDVDGSDGWDVSAAAGPHLDGDGWVVHAVAFDARGRSGAARSEAPFAIVGRDRPVLRFTQPSHGSGVGGIVAVTVQAMYGSRFAEGIDLCAETAGGRLIALGAMEERAGRWSRDWNTADLADGDYGLVAIVRHADGRISLVRGGDVRIRNAGSGFFFSEPGAGDVVRGAPLLHLVASDGAAPATEVHVYYRDVAGELHSIGPARPAGPSLAEPLPEAAPPAVPEEWSLVWDTAGVLDGPYDLVAGIRGADGQMRYAEQRVVVDHGVTPSLTARPAEGDVVDGVQQIGWRVEARARVALEWSPDGGVHWLALADDLEAEGTFEWDTAQEVDTSRAMLRVTAVEGARRAAVQAGPFTIDNANEAPAVALLAPVTGAAHGSPLFVAWRAWDPDGDPLLIDLHYRAGLDAWQPLAQGITGAQSFSWDITDLAPAPDYSLRVTVRDPDGAEASDEVTRLTLLANRPPTVRLVTPNESAVVGQDTVILWQAEDPDDDPLFIDLYYSDDAGRTWLPLADGITNTGYYRWQASFLPMGPNYRVRVVARDGFHRAYDDSDGTFVVGGTLPPTLHLLRPAAGERIAGLVPVQWDSAISPGAGLTATVSIRHAGETRWDNLIEGVPDDGVLIWDTTALADGVYELRVAVGDGEDETSATVSVTVANHRNERPEVALLAPVGGEVWRGTREIVWRAWDNDGDPLSATIAISVDGGATWQDLATEDARLGHYVWDTGVLPDGVHALLARVVVSDGQIAATAVTPAPFHVANGACGPTVRWLSPDDAGGLWRGRVVSWETGSVSSARPQVTLQLRRDDVAGAPLALAWQTVAEASYDAGEAVVPEDWLIPGRSYRLRLIADDGALRVSRLSAPFEVTTAGSEPPVATLERPAGGETWSGEQEIRWQARAPDGRELRVTLELSQDGGATWFELARDQANAGLYAWDTTAVGNGVYRLRLTAGDGRAESTVVSAPFRVENPGGNAPALSLVSPQPQEVWAGTREVQWRAEDRDGDALAVTLAYSLDGGGTWRRFAFNVPATEGYLWDTTTVPNVDAVWLRATVSDGALTAEDYAGPFIVRNARGPVVALLAPLGGEQWSGEQRIAWYTGQEAGRTAKTMLQYSADGGRTWQTIAHDLAAQGSYRWDTAEVPDYTGVLLRAYVSDGQQSAVATTRTPVRVRHLPAPAEEPFYLP